MPLAPAARRRPSQGDLPRALAGASLLILALAGPAADAAGGLPDPVDPAVRPEATAAQPSSTAHVLDAIWAVPEGEPLAVAAAGDGGAYALLWPRRTAADFRSVVRYAPDGSIRWRRMLRDGDGSELRPLAAVAGSGEDLFLATDRLLLRLDGAGNILWEAPAGDGHPDFGPAARGLARAGDSLFGVDLANARVLGYRVDSGGLKLRLGTPGSAPGSYLAPVDVAVLEGGDLVVAEHGNRRLQRLDAMGNPLARWPLPARPRAVAAAGTGVWVALDDETVRALDGSGREIEHLGGFGREPGQFQLVADLAVLGDQRLLVADRANGRLQVFRPLAADETPDPPLQATTTAPGTPTNMPPGAATDPAPGNPPTGEPLVLSACPGQPARLPLGVPLPPAAPRLDVLFVVDTTGSMESLLSNLRGRVTELAAALADLAPDVALGLVDVRDFPYGRAGLAGDWPWLLRARLSTDPAGLAAAAGELWAGGGGDAPEAYAGALLAALDEPRVGWRPGSRRFVVLLGDAVPRDTDLNAELANPPLPGTWTPGLPPWWRDSGADWAPGSVDDPRWLAVLDAFRAAQVTLLVGVTGVAPLELAGNPGALRRYWEAWASRGGPGGRAVLLADLARLPAEVQGLVAGASGLVARLAPRAEPAERAAWVAFAPPELTDLAIPAEGLQVGFEAAIEAPAGTADGRYSLALVAVGDGAEYARQELELVWRASCALPPSPTVEPPTAEPTPSPAASATPSATATATETATPWPSATATRRPPQALVLPLLQKGHCLATQRVTSDIILVLDISSSMRAEGKLEAALSAAGAFVDLVDSRRDRLALVTFHRRAELLAGLSADRARLKAALATVITGEGTRLDLGLGVALDELAGPRRQATARPVLILLTDGLPDAGSEAALAATVRRLREAGVTVYAIGLGSDVDAELLRQIAGGASRYYPAPTKNELAGIYQRIAEVLPCG